jgi:hypothetical protein
MKCGKPSRGKQRGTSVERGDFCAKGFSEVSDCPTPSQGKRVAERVNAKEGAQLPTVPNICRMVEGVKIDGKGGNETPMAKTTLSLRLLLW